MFHQYQTLFHIRKILTFHIILRVKLFGGTVPPNIIWRGRTFMEISFLFGKGDILNEKIRLPPLEVHFGVGGCGRTDSAGGACQE